LTVTPVIIFKAQQNLVSTEKMFLLRYGLVLALLSSALAFPPPISVHATIIHVPGGGSIQAAINSAAVNDTILVSSGTYLERLLIDKPLHLVGESGRDSTIIDGSGQGTVVWIGADNVEVRGFTIQNSDPAGWGIHVDRANGVNITGNSISASLQGDGVNLSGSNFTLVSNNVFTGNLYAVNITDSVSARVLNNQAVLNDPIGVQLLNSNSSVVFNNNFQGGQEGLDLVQASRNNVTRNLFKGMLYRGISLTSTPPSPQYPGRRLSQDNIVNENTFERNERGVDVENATGNTFYHNDFFLSGFRHVNLIFPSDAGNTWDNSTLGPGFVSGNFWDNYTGVDTNYDGIGDTQLPVNRVDFHPLVRPFLPEPILIRAILASPSQGPAPLTVVFTPEVNGTLTPFTYSWSFGDGSGLASGAGVTHTFSRAGTFTVVLTVKDTAAGSDSALLAVQVSPPVPVSYTLVIVLGVVAVLAVAGLLFWKRRRRMKGRKDAATLKR